jgi:hypothetical protein
MDSLIVPSRLSPSQILLLGLDPHSKSLERISKPGARCSEWRNKSWLERITLPLESNEMKRPYLIDVAGADIVTV